MSRPHRIASALGLSLLASAACDIFEGLENPRTLVNVAVTHHATPEAGAFPDRGADGETRTFETDEGWSVILEKAYVTTSAVTLHRCDEGEVDFDFYWGPLAEDMRTQDLDMQTLAGEPVRSSEFCGMAVQYGPDPGYVSDVAYGGATFYLEGTAAKAGVVFPFTVSSFETLDVSLDLSTMDGGDPLVVEGGEDAPVELTVSKTYDRFFDGIDFGSAGAGDLQAQVASVLVLETSVSRGRVAPR
ncbi:MAG: hypothetical protein IAG13_13135 [Deltaproteobacteria bacterium]|nr:hypothetical protein [Nannocystaceae bacterium]